MLIASRMFLAAALAAGLMAPRGAHAAVQEFKISLTDMTFERGSGLSAEAAAFGGSGPVPLLKNGFYNETLTGDYTVIDDLPPSDQLAYWQTFTQISLNGVPFLTANQLVFESQDQVFAAILNLTHINPLVLKIIIGTLEHHNNISTGIFDYAYNPPPTASDRTHGTFAVGSTEGGSTDDPLSVFEPVSASTGPNVWSLAFSATFFAPAPEPPTWGMLIAGGGGLLAIRALARRRTMARRVPA